MMLGPLRIKNTKPAPKRPLSKSRFTFIRIFMDKCYRDPYRWGLIKSLAFFAGSVFAVRVLSDLDILPADGPSDPQVAY